jgi:hypothetical protein
VTLTGAFAGSNSTKGGTMPDWYVRRNSAESTYPFQIRLGGCEYSLTEEEWNILMYAFMKVNASNGDFCVESEGYQDIVISSGNDKRSLSDIMGFAKPTMRRF